MNTASLFELLKEVDQRPAPFQYYTATELWNEHTARQMLKYHLDDSVEASSRNSKFIDRSVEWIIQHFGVDQQTAIADFGCGPGHYTNRLAAAGAQVTGIDFSENSIRYAGQTAEDQGLSVNYRVQNYLDYDTDDRFDLIMMIMCDFCALSPAQRSQLLAKFRKLLAPGGKILLDVYTMVCFQGKSESFSFEKNQLNGFWSPNEYYGFHQSYVYRQDAVTLDKYTIVEADIIRTVYNWLQYFTPDSIREEFERQGFAVESMIADVAGTPFCEDAAEMAVIASAR